MEDGGRAIGEHNCARIEQIGSKGREKKAVHSLKKYKTTIFHTAGKPLK